MDGTSVLLHFFLKPLKMKERDKSMHVKDETVIGDDRDFSREKAGRQ